MRRKDEHRRCEDRNERSDVRIAASGRKKFSLGNFLQRMHIINRRGTIGVERVDDRNSVSKFELMNEVMRQKFISTRVSEMQTQRVRESER